MWDADHFPTGYIPWPLLIRARFEFELDAVVSSVIVETLRDFTSDEVGEKIARSARFSGGGESRSKAEPAHVLATMSAIADYFEWCGTVPRRWPPRPRPSWFSELGDPIANLMIERALNLVEAVGSSSLKKNLGETLGALSQETR